MRGEIGVLERDWRTIIARAALAGALSYWARQDEKAAPGLNRLADRYRADYRALMG